jgi:hypothetical protein
VSDEAGFRISCAMFEPELCLFCWEDGRWKEDVDEGCLLCRVPDVDDICGPTMVDPDAVDEDESAEE